MPKIAIKNVDGSLSFAPMQPEKPKANAKDTCAAIRAFGMSVRHNNGEYRVTFPGLPTDRQDALAYYTNDAEDAIANAIIMASKAGETLSREKANAVVITRDNVDSLLDRRQIEVAKSNGRWWEIRRNGATRTFKRDANRIEIPFKAGMRGYGTISQSDFLPNGVINPDTFRVKQPR